jgi:transcriptional regulator with XRE-family HTH domain
MARRTDITIRFGQRVRELRERAELSQEEFAWKCQLDRTYISGIERGKRNVALRNIEAIAKALEVSISALMKGL